MRYVTLGDTFYFKFTTRDFDTGAPQTLGGTPVISAYEDANLTQITAGITLTVDYDSVTGLNHVAVVATAGNGYEAGKYYAFTITTGTVDTVSVVGEVVHEIVVGPVDANVAQISGDATAADNCELFFDGTGYAGGATMLDVNIASTDDIDLSATQKASVNTEVDNAIVTYGLDHLVSASVAGTDIADSSIIASMVSSAATPDWDTFVNTTDSLQATRDHIGDGTNLTEAGGDGDHLTAINLPNQTMNITGDITGNLSGSVGSVTGAVGSVTAEVSADMVKISGSTAAADNLEETTETTLHGTASGTPTTTTMVSNIGVTVDDQFNGRIIVFKSGTTTAALRNQATDITGCTASTNTLTFTALTTAPASGDTFMIV